MNMSPRLDGVEFYVGDIHALRSEWKVGDKRLYEIGLEFVVRASIELPLQSVTFGKNLHLWKCPEPEALGQRGQVRVYDGWLELERQNPDSAYLRSAVAAIGVAVNRLGFAYQGVVDWRLKYSLTETASGFATPTEQDLEGEAVALLDHGFSDGQCAAVAGSGPATGCRLPAGRSATGPYLSGRRSR
jgi:hypothetical protein